MGKSYCCLEVINCFCVKHPKREQNYEKIGHICLVSVGNIQIECKNSRCLDVTIYFVVKDPKRE